MGDFFKKNVVSKDGKIENWYLRRYYYYRLGRRKVNKEINDDGDNGGVMIIKIYWLLSNYFELGIVIRILYLMFIILFLDKEKSLVEFGKI